MKEFNDRLLLELLKKDDEKVFSHLFESYYVPLCRYARLILKSEQPAEEVVILGRVADDDRPQLCLEFGKYWRYYTVTGRAAQQRYVNGGQKNTAWILSSPLDWAAVEAYFPSP